VIAPARTAALRGLRAVAEHRVDLPAALAQARGQLTDERDRALAAEIISGSLRWQRSLDSLVEHFAGRPIAQIDADVLLILRLSLYQLLHLDRVPASAVVDDAVDLTRGARKQSATGFVNAVLRSTLRNRHRLPLPERPEDPVGREAALAYLGISHSHPEWLVSRWLSRHGFHAAERWVRFNNETPPLTLRANRLRLTREQLAAALEREGIDTEPTPYAPDGLFVRSGNPIRLLGRGEEYDGLFVVQDEASQLVPLVADARPNSRVLDLCASPGGKTTAMAAAMASEGIVVASDVRPRRVRMLAHTVRASGATNVRMLQVPPSGPLPFAPVFDSVLVDAPCSGLGTIRRDPDIRWRRREEDLASLAGRQLDLVRRAAAVLTTGGRLVYATCSSEPEENEGVVEQFLRDESEFTLVDLRGMSPLLDAFIDGHGMMRTLPFAHGLEAFFAAALVKR
jgi:16S rRNA (cytosine967-C5)-methyltransferase